MKLRASVYENVDGDLHPKGAGECVAYTPTTNSTIIPYVALNFGKFHIHLNKEDFTAFCKHFLEFSLYNTRKEIK